jgi:shikimate dehydrogenase
MVGAYGEGRELFPDEVLSAAELFVDIVYYPLVTETMERAHSLGTPAVNGVGMLLGLGSLCFELFFHRSAPTAVMRSAVEEALSLSL